jgi:hypothetical protein
LNFNLSLSNFKPIGFLDPLKCKKNKCNPLIPIKIKGKRKCNVKNRVRAVLSKELPPHNPFKIPSPAGRTLISPVITLAPQNLI